MYRFCVVVRLKQDLLDLAQLSCFELILDFAIDLSLLVLLDSADLFQTDRAVHGTQLSPVFQITIEVGEDTARVRHVATEERSKHPVGEIIVRADVGQRVGDRVGEAGIGNVGDDREELCRQGGDTGNGVALQLGSGSDENL